MLKEFKEELKQLKIKMEGAEKFIKKLPVFKEQIIEHKYKGDESFLDFGKKYKDIYLAWGIKRCLFSSDTNRYVTNYKGKEYSEFLFSIYINSVSLFDNYYDFNLEDIIKKTEIFFYDKSNSNFYATDEQIEGLLDELNVWYLKAMKENDKLLTKKRLKNAEEELKKVKEKISLLRE